MRILITNDDGIFADGIERLAAVASRYGEVWVAAPDRQQSAGSHSITLSRPIDVYERAFPVKGVHAYAVTGTPSDCVRLGVHNLMPEKPDLVLTGINYGYNAGTDVQYSATVGAAMEAVFQGIPAVAFSEGRDEAHAVTGKYLDDMVQLAVERRYIPDEILNINFPGCPISEFKGILHDRFVSPGCIYTDRYVGEKMENGGIRYSIRPIENADFEEGSDLRAIFDGYISVGVVSNYR